MEMARWGQTLEDLRRASLEAPHPRTRERLQALYLIASGRFNATTCALHIGRQDETVLGWVHRYNARGPEALAYRRSGGRAPFYPAAGPADRRRRREQPPGGARPARPRLDAEEAPAVGPADLRPGRRPQQPAPRPASGRPDVEEGQEAAGAGQPPEAGRPRPGVAEAVRRRVQRGRHPDLRG